MNTIQSKVKQILFSILATCGIGIYYNIQLSRLENSGIFLALLGLYLFLYKYPSKINKNEKRMLLTASIIYSIFLCAGRSLEYRSILGSYKELLFKSFLIFFAIYKLITVGYEKIKSITEDNHKENIKTILLIIFIGNLLTFLAIYPGVYGYDTGYQILEFMHPSKLTTKFSLTTSFMIYECVSIGKLLFKNYEAGLAIYSVIQMLFLTYVESKIILTSQKLFNNKKISLIYILFLAFSPFITILNVSTAQDTLFGAFFALITIELINYIYYEEKLDKKKSIKLGFIIIMACLSRNNGIYAIGFIFPFLYFLKSKNKKTLSITILVSLLIFKAIMLFFEQGLGIADKTKMREIVSLPSQQMARVYYFDSKTYTEDEVKQLRRFYPKMDKYWIYYQYNLSIADSTKYAIDSTYTKKHFKEYIAFWLRNGIESPRNYIEAAALNTYGFWYIGKQYNDKRMYHPLIEYNMLDAKLWHKDYIAIKRKTLLKSYEKYLSNIVLENNWKNIPIINVIFSISFPLWILLLLIIQNIINKNIKVLTIFSIFMGYYITIFLGPVAFFRYVYPIVICMPLIISMIIKEAKQKNKN